MSNDSSPAEPAGRRDADALHAETLVVDGHADTLLDILDGDASFERMPPEHHIDFTRARAGGLDAEFFTAFVDPTEHGTRSNRRAADLLRTLHEQVARFPDRMGVVGSVEELLEVASGGRLAAIPAIEGGHALEDSLDALAWFHARGVRLMTLTWNNSNNWADGCLPGRDDPRHGGLTDFGRRVIGEMERLGVIVDVSHAAPETFEDVARIATKPFVASHSCAHALTPHVRNLTDAQLRTIAGHGGVVGVCFASQFLFDEAAVWRELKAGPEYAAIPPERRTEETNPALMSGDEQALYLRRVPRATLDHVVAHVDHMVSVMGVAHVALGSDFDGVHRLPVGLDDAAALPAVTRALAARGYSAADLAAILGGNWLRVIGAVCGGPA